MGLPKSTAEIYFIEKSSTKKSELKWVGSPFYTSLYIRENISYHDLIINRIRSTISRFELCQAPTKTVLLIYKSGTLFLLSDHLRICWSADPNLMFTGRSPWIRRSTTSRSKYAGLPTQVQRKLNLIRDFVQILLALHYWQ